MVVPRWEWRSFGDRFGDAEAVLAALVPQQVVESTELYLLSAAGTDVVKVRDDLMDIKHLQRVDVAGLEQWNPVLKAGFPLTADDWRLVVAALGEGSGADLAQAPPRSVAALVEDVVEPTPALRAVEVRKRRHRYLLDDCMAELTTVDADRHRTRTLAVESEDPVDVLTALRQMHVEPLPNVNFGRGLKVIERFGAERFAVIDVGTNSVKFHIGDRDAVGAWHRVVDRSVVTRLGEGLADDGRLGAEPMSRTIEAIAAMAEEARQERVGALAAVGTAGLRIAANSGDFLREVGERSGVVVEVISGDDEARLAYLAATAGLPVEGPSVVFDTGGGSSQFTFGDGRRVAERFSLDVGAARFTEKFGLDGAVAADTVAEARAAIARDLGRLDGRPSPQTLIGMGGAVTNLTSVKHRLEQYDPDIVHGTVLDRAEVERQVELYRGRTAGQRREVVGLQPQRAETILAGACIVATVLEKLGRDALTVSDRGLRYGVLEERFGLAE